MPSFFRHPERSRRTSSRERTFLHPAKAPSPALPRCAGEGATKVRYGEGRRFLRKEVLRLRSVVSPSFVVSSTAAPSVIMSDVEGPACWLLAALVTAEPAVVRRRMTESAGRSTQDDGRGKMMHFEHASALVEREGAGGGECDERVAGFQDRGVEGGFGRCEVGFLEFVFVAHD